MNWSRYLSSYLLGGAIVLFFPASVRSQQGNVDPTFNLSALGGRVTTAVVVAGASAVTDTYILGCSDPVRLVRLLNDGSIDNTFHPQIPNLARITQLAISPTGIIVVANGTSGGNSIVRVDFAGNLDPTFSAIITDGTAINALIVQTNGGFLLGGDFTNCNGVTRNGAARFSATGSLDSTFNPVFSSPTHPTVAAIALYPDQRFVLGGNFTTSNSVHGVARYSAAGVYDSVYGARIASAVSGILSVSSLLIQSTDSLIVSAQFSPATFTTIRLDSSGNLDSGFRNDQFGPTGAILYKLPYSDEFLIDRSNLVNPPPDYQIMRCSAETGEEEQGFGSFRCEAVGRSRNTVSVSANDGRFVAAIDGTLFRFLPGGSADKLFNVGLGTGPNAPISHLSIDSTGRTIIAGNFSAFNNTGRYGIARMRRDGSRDPDYLLITAVELAPGTVHAVATQADDKVLFGGKFYVPFLNTQTGLGRLNVDDGSVEINFSLNYSGGFDGLIKDVQCLALESDGSILVGALGVGVYRVNRDGTNPNVHFDVPFFTTITTITPCHDGSVLIGGYSVVAGAPVAGLARFDHAGAPIGSFSAEVASHLTILRRVVELGPPNYPILIAGALSDNVDPTSGVVELGLMQLLANGTRDSTFQNVLIQGGTENGQPKNIVNAIVPLSSGKTVIGGSFGSVNGIPKQNLAVINSNGTVGSFDGFTPSMAGSVFDMVADGTGIEIAGEFVSVDNYPRSYVARINFNGAIDLSFNPGVGKPSISGLALQPDTNVVLGGNFRSISGLDMPALARVNSDGTADPTFRPDFTTAGDSVSVLTRHPSTGQIFAAGIFGKVGSSGARPTASAFERTGLGAWVGPHPDAGSRVGTPVVRTNGVTGELDTTYYEFAGANGPINALTLLPDGKLLVAGAFDKLNLGDGVGYALSTNIGRLTAGGNWDGLFGGGADAAIYAMCLQSDGNIIIGGDFTQVVGLQGINPIYFPRNRVARLTGSGYVDSTFNPGIGANGRVSAIGIQPLDGRILLGGSFSQVQGITRQGLARLNVDGSLDETFSPLAITYLGGPPTINSILLQTDNKIIVAGLFDSIGGFSSPNVARLLPNGAVDTSYNTGAGPDDMVLITQLQPDEKLLLGGDFQLVANFVRDAGARLKGDTNGAPSLQSWRLANFGSVSNSGMGADNASPFGDGVPNLLKYALNMIATAADSSRMTLAGTKGLPLQGLDAGRHLTLTFVRRKDSTYPGITYFVEYGDTLSGTFAVNPNATTSTPTAIDSTWERVTVTDSVVIVGQSDRFVRLRITDP